MNTAERDGKGVADIGSRLEPFVDDWLIESMQGVDLKLHPPERCETALAFDAPWEGSSSAYVTVFKDGERYRMYYRGSSADRPRQEVTCCAESEDGIHWHRPAFGACEFAGSRDNNIVLTEVGSHNFMPFRDANPHASEAERYKAIGGGYHGFVSPDGIHWKTIRDEKIIDPFAKCVGDGDWIGQAFWDAGQEHYVAYVRGWRGSDPIRFQHELPAEHDGTLYPLCHVPDTYRQVLRCTSTDFIDWTEPEFINFGGTPPEHFYTNAVTPYFRAPHVYLAFPKRFAPERKKVEEHDKDGVSDAVFLSSRDGMNFDRRFMEAFLRPGRDRLNWTQRSNMPAWGVVPTGPDEISIYFSENYDHPTGRLRRARLRTDGFVSVHADYRGGELVTRPIVFRGGALILNYATSAVGSVQAEIQDGDGRPVPGHALADSAEIYGDEIEHAVAWKGGSDLTRLSGRPVRLRFVMKDADLYSIRFR